MPRLKWQIMGFSPKAGRTVMTNFKLWAKAKTGHFTSAPLCLLYNFKFMLLNSTEKSWIIIFKLNPAVILWARERTEELFWILLKNFWLLLVLLRKCWWTGCRTVTHWHDWLRLTINKETRMSHRGSSSAGFSQVWGERLSICFSGRITPDLVSYKCDIFCIVEESFSFINQHDLHHIHCIAYS